MLATKGLHYKDLNTGNIRALRGSLDSVLIIDFGNGRERRAP